MRRRCVGFLWLLLLLPTTPAAAQSLAGWSKVETDHFRFYFPPQPAADPAAFTSREESAFAQLRATFGGALPGKIDFYVWNTNHEAERLLGRPAGFARPDLLLIHAAANQTPGHELTHVLLFHTLRPEQTTRFIEEGTAVAFDLTTRDRVALARTALQHSGGNRPSILALWQQGGRTPENILYPVAGAFVDRLLARGGRERFFQLLKRQTPENARIIYGEEFDRIVREFEAEISAPATDKTSAGQETELPTLETLRAQAQERMRRDRSMYSADELREIETMYQAANSPSPPPGSKEKLEELVRKYPKSNRAGCAVLYLAQLSRGAEKEQHLKNAIANHADARYGNGVQVGAFARAQLAMFYAASGALAEAQKLAEEVRTLYPGAVDHSGARLDEALRRRKLLQ